MCGSRVIDSPGRVVSVGLVCSLRLEGDEAKASHVLLLVVLFLEAHNALAFLQNDVVPLSHSTVCFDFANGEIVLVAEANLVDPVLGGLDADFADGAVLVDDHLLVALVDAGVACERRRHAIRQVELHRENATDFVVLDAGQANVLELAGRDLGEVFLLGPD